MILTDPKSDPALTISVGRCECARLAVLLECRRDVSRKWKSWPGCCSAVPGTKNSTAEMQQNVDIIHVDWRTRGIGGILKQSALICPREALESKASTTVLPHIISI